MSRSLERHSARWLEPKFAHLLRRLEISPRELVRLATAFACVFVMFTGYAMLRPVRDAMGVTSGVRSLPALAWAIFAVMILLQPVYAALIHRLNPRAALPWVYALIALSLLAFYAWFYLQQDNVWIARAWFVWVSVFNLFAVSVFWTLMVDVYTRAEAARLFGLLASGFSLGGLAGPALAALLAEPIGTINLLLIAAALFFVAAWLMGRVVRLSDSGSAHGGEVLSAAGSDTTSDEPVFKVGLFDAFKQVAASRYLLSIALFVVMVTLANAVLYAELQRLVAETIASRDAQTAFFARVDFVVQAGALVTQLLLFPLLLHWLGFARVLCLAPILMLLAFSALAAAPVLAVVVGGSIARRVSEFGLVRPAREMLFTIANPAEKYLAKSLIDTFVFRGGDAIAASLYAAVIALAATTVFAAHAAGLWGVAISLLWIGVAWWLARQFDLSASRARDAASRLEATRF
jgi:ATP:ADP antiporter, AAA family